MKVEKKTARSVYENMLTFFWLNQMLHYTQKQL